jgi:hypothetical protein
VVSAKKSHRRASKQARRAPGLVSPGHLEAPLADAVSKFETAMAHRDLAALRAMAAPQNKTDHLLSDVRDYGGHPVRATSYENSYPGEVMVGLTAECGSTRSVEFGNDFLYQDGAWHPSFGQHVEDRDSDVPAPTFPPAEPLGPLPSPSTPSSC